MIPIKDDNALIVENRKLARPLYSRSLLDARRMLHSQSVQRNTQ
jgi:hypothetical protein